MKTLAQAKISMPNSESYGFPAIANPIPGFISIFLFLCLLFAILKYGYDLLKYSRKNVIQNSILSLLTGAISGVIFLVTTVLGVGLALQFNFIWIFVVFYFITAIFALPPFIMKPIETKFNSEENARFLYTSAVFFAHFLVIFIIYSVMVTVAGPEAIFGPGYYF